jgi:autonomous glycyl radical cofactor GrcA
LRPGGRFPRVPVIIDDRVEHDPCAVSAELSVDSPPRIRFVGDLASRVVTVEQVASVRVVGEQLAQVAVLSESVRHAVSRPERRRD